jgi:tRNA (pseudouridine54-N1)-methyltransferase
MKHFIYFSNSATTSGKALSNNEGNLMKAGRMDIALHVIIASFFLSHDTRKDVKLHLVFYGMPTPPRHIEITLEKGLDISKKDIAGLIKKILYKYKEGQKTEVFPGVFIEKKSFLSLVQELIDKGKEIFILDKKGEDIREIKTKELENAVFVLGDQDGLPEKELRRLKKSCKMISIGNKMYFASQVVAILNNELDRREL